MKNQYIAIVATKGSAVIRIMYSLVMCLILGQNGCVSGNSNIVLAEVTSGWMSEQDTGAGIEKYSDEIVDQLLNAPFVWTRVATNTYLPNNSYVLLTRGRSRLELQRDMGGPRHFLRQASNNNILKEEDGTTFSYVARIENETIKEMINLKEPCILYVGTPATWIRRGVASPPSELEPPMVNALSGTVWMSTDVAFFDEDALLSKGVSNELLEFLGTRLWGREVTITNTVP